MAQKKNSVKKQNRKPTLTSRLASTSQEAIARRFSAAKRYAALQWFIACYLVLLTGLYRSRYPFYLLILFLCFILFRFIRNHPHVQIISTFREHITSMLGAFFGVFALLKWITLRAIRNNPGVLLLIGLYILLMLSVIRWGLPSSEHPFTYHMDEWHQLNAVRFTITSGNPNQPGAAYGPLLHFLLSGFYLIPFVVIGYLNPFLLTSSLAHYDMQMRTFEVLRTNTILFGIISLIGMAVIAKRYVKVPEWWAVSLFLFTPLFLSLSNYFKYDIALIAWLVWGLAALFHFSERPSLERYILAGIVFGCALATKISALPALALYIFAYFLFVPKKVWDVTVVIRGVAVYILVFLLFGIPNLFFGRGDYREFLYSNFVTVPQETSMYSINMPYQQYLLSHQLPFLFGYGIAFIGIVSLLYWLVRIIRSLVRKRTISEKSEFLICTGLILFALSLTSLKITGTGNRALVLLPFLVLLSMLLLQRLMKWWPKAVSIFYAVIIIVQIIQCLPWMSMKWHEDPRKTSSRWITENIPPGEVIGIENIPIYQYLPDVVLKEFYEQQEKRPRQYQYEVIDPMTPKLPKTIILTNADIAERYEIKSKKKDLLERLTRERYIKVSEFYPRGEFITPLISRLDFYIANTGPVAPIPQIAIYKKGLVSR